MENEQIIMKVRDQSYDKYLATYVVTKSTNIRSCNTCVFYKDRHCRQYSLCQYLDERIKNKTNNKYRLVKISSVTPNFRVKELSSLIYFSKLLNLMKRTEIITNS